MKKLYYLLLTLVILSHALEAQRPDYYSAADIALELERLRKLGTVLYIAAHPDDENTRLIAYLSNGEKLRTGYLSLTRGDGGQNLTGHEIREKLGIIRTQELLQARRTDGGEQFFSRADDFGFSKHPDETFTVWERDQILNDVVYVIRKFKPDVIITRFSTEPGNTHGHHTASAILAEEAFRAAGDPSRFPEQLKTVSVWQPERLLWNTSSWFYRNKEDFDTTSLLKVDVGLYNSLLGKSYSEIAAESRSMHKSQGFGSALTRGPATEYLQPVLGSKDRENLFKGINTTWSRVKGGEKIEKLIQAAIESYKIKDPSAIVPQLLEIYEAMLKLPAHPYKEVKIQETKDLIKACLGLYLEAASTEAGIVPGDSLKLAIEVTNRSSFPLTLKSVSIPAAKGNTESGKTLVNNEKWEEKLIIKVPESQALSQPYWLVNEPENGMFKLDDEKNIAKPENDPALMARFNLLAGNVDLSYSLPVVYKYTEPAEGEIYQPLMITPPVAVNPKENKLLFANGGVRELVVEVVAGKDSVQGSLEPKLPQGWKSEPASVRYDLYQKGAGSTFTFTIEPPVTAEETFLTVEATYNGKTYSRGMEWIKYDHIPAQALFPEAKVKLVKLDLKVEGKKIGYVMGAGDEIPQNLEQAGFAVELLQPHELEPAHLQQYDAVVLGVRAYNTREELKFKKAGLEEYARNGGVVVVQYNTSFGLADENFAPFPIKLSRKRITNENAPLKILQPDHPVFQSPNKITQKDFEGWVQERGLYFAEEWSDEWTPLLSGNDPGEEPLEGGLLVAKTGKGYFVYTGFSWFRQLPAGVPGAYRIFTNIVSLGNSGL